MVSSLHVLGIVRVHGGSHDDGIGSGSVRVSQHGGARGMVSGASVSRERWPC